MFKRRFRDFGVAAALLAGLWTASAGAQMPPAQPVNNPPVNNPPAPVTANAPYRGGNSDYPAAEVQAIPMARARLATARAEQEQALNDLHLTVDRMHEDFENSAEMVTAVKAEDKAYLEYDDARRKVLTRLSDDPTYRAMINLVVTLKHKIEDERPAGKPTSEHMEEVFATATLKLSYASAASAMESAALAADSDVQTTRAKLMEAGSKTAELRTTFAKRIRRDPEFLAARRALDDARIIRLTAEAFYSGAIDAREIALNYAYYIHRYDQYSYSPAQYSSWNPYPYGYGPGYVVHGY